jgi:hypothetical protein
VVSPSSGTSVTWPFGMPILLLDCV